MTDFHVEKVLHIRNVNKICNMRKLCAQHMVYSRILRCFVAKSVVFAIYAVLLQDRLCRDLHTFVWGKIVPVEKKDKNQVCNWAKF